MAIYCSSLKKNEKDLYDNLNSAIQQKNVDRIKVLLEQGKKDGIDVAKIVSAVDDNSDTLLI
jgi:hypothetical protein